MRAAPHIQQLREQAHQALASALPGWPATLQAAQDHAGCRQALSSVVVAMLALRPPAYPKPAHPTRPAGAGANLMRLPLRPLPAHDRRRAAAGDVDDVPTTLEDHQP